VCKRQRQRIRGLRETRWRWARGGAREGRACDVGQGGSEEEGEEAKEKRFVLTGHWSWAGGCRAP